MADIEPRLSGKIELAELKKPVLIQDNASLLPKEAQGGTPGGTPGETPA